MKTEGFRGAAFEAHRLPGPGFLESVYEEALAVELERNQLLFERQVEIPIFYRTAQVGIHRLALIVAENVVVELKTFKRVTLKQSPRSSA
jgi:GxxExxY protein